MNNPDVTAVLYGRFVKQLCCLCMREQSISGREMFENFSWKQCQDKKIPHSHYRWLS